VHIGSRCYSPDSQLSAGEKAFKVAFIQPSDIGDAAEFTGREADGSATLVAVAKGPRTHWHKGLLARPLLYLR